MPTEPRKRIRASVPALLVRWLTATIATFSRAAISCRGIWLPFSAHADTGGITLVVYKGGWIIGGSAGHGMLTFHGRNYPVAVGGIDYGLLFGGSRTVLY